MNMFPTITLMISEGETEKENDGYEVNIVELEPQNKGRGRPSKNNKDDMPTTNEFDTHRIMIFL
jgi:hypothetical protein